MQGSPAKARRGQAAGSVQSWPGEKTQILTTKQHRHECLHMQAPHEALDNVVCATRHDSLAAPADKGIVMRRTQQKNYILGK